MSDSLGPAGAEPGSPAPTIAVPARRRDRPEEKKRRPVALLVVLALVLLLVAAAAWIAVRGLMARDALTAAVPLASTAVEQVGAGDLDAARATLADMGERTDEARTLTSDPLWRAAEVVPFVGGNLTVVRESADILADVVDDAAPPLLDAAAGVDLDALAPRDGAIDLQPLLDAQPGLTEASGLLASALDRAERLDTDGTVGAVTGAAEQLTGRLAEVHELVAGLEGAAALLPPMLGAEGPRSYLLLSLNNAEVRATGGIPGAVALIRVADGRPELAGTFSTSDVGSFDSAVLPVSESEDLLYSDRMTRYLQDVTFTPDFARSGEIAAEMWRQRTGESVSGVLSVDPVLLSYLLGATGPVTTFDGTQIDADNAVPVLLSDVYARFEQPALQDAFFAEVAARVFERLVSGGDPQQLLGALTRGAEEQRLHIWSADADEQQRLAAAGLTGALPVSDADGTGIGVYLNDGTGAKMNYYTEGAVTTRSIDCRQDGRPYFQVGVRLSSTAPVDAASVLPEYVTGGGSFGVAPGETATGLFVYVPEGSDVYSVQVNGREEAFVLTEDAGHVAAAISTLLTPGEQVDVVVSFVAPEQASTTARVTHTPLATDFGVETQQSMTCPDLDRPDQVTAARQSLDDTPFVLAPGQRIL